MSTVQWQGEAPRFVCNRSLSTCAQVASIAFMCRKYYIHFISPNRFSKKHGHIDTHIHSHIQIYTYIRTYTNNIYTHTTVYVEAIELDNMADTLTSRDKYKPNLTSNFCMRLAHRTLGRSKPKYSWQCLTVSMLLVSTSRRRVRDPFQPSCPRGRIMVGCACSTRRSFLLGRYHYQFISPV